MNKKYFTPEEANQLLPYVREEISFLQGLKSQFQDAYREREQMKKSQSATDDDLFTLECKLEFMEMEAQMRLQHLAASGIQVKDIDIGLVDFPALLDGEEVLLCWREGEEAVEHYHGLYDGFIGRKKLD